MTINKFLLIIITFHFQPATIKTMKNLRTKYFTTTLELINSLTKDQTFTFDAPGHHLNGCAIELKKTDGQFSFETISQIQKGLQNHKEIQFDRDTDFKLTNKNRTLYLKGKDYFINKIKYLEHDSKLSNGSINALSSQSEVANSKTNYMRCVIPVGKENKMDLKHFQKTMFNTDKGTSFLFTCDVNGHNFDLINYKRQELNYFVIDCLDPIDKKAFQKKCYNIILTVGLLRGDLIFNENFLLTYSDNTFNKPDSIEYISMRSSVISNQPLITTNPYSIRPLDEDFERDENGRISEAQKNKLYEGIMDFTGEAFSKLATLFCEHEKLQRATLLFILGHVATLEIRIPNYYVALEAITSYLAKTVDEKPKRLNPIKDKKLANDLVNEIKELIKKKKDDDGLSDDEMNTEILFKNINRLNSPPNADKLAKSFEIIKYPLTKEQFKIIKDRNSYLHGSFIKTSSEDDRFKDALHLSLRLHFLIGVLLLKNVGYNGKIINYAKLWSHITQKDIEEEVLVFI